MSTSSHGEIARAMQEANLHTERLLLDRILRQAILKYTCTKTTKQLTANTHVNKELTFPVVNRYC